VAIHKIVRDICYSTRIVVRGWENIQRREVHSAGAEHSVLLRRYTVLLGEHIATFRRIVMLPSSGSIILVAIMTLMQAGNCLVVHTTKKTS